MKEIKLSQGKIALVDDEDFERINKHKWTYSSDGYAINCSTIKRKNHTTKMHRDILHLKSSDPDVDHINGNKSDNRKSNLRLCTASQNMGNSKLRLKSRTGFKGVTFDKESNQFRAQIIVNQKHYHLGRFDDPRVAAIAYDMAALKAFGDFALTNGRLGRFYQYAIDNNII